MITTLGGLCRYRFGDVVRLAGFHGTAPLVEVRVTHRVSGHAS